MTLNIKLNKFERVAGLFVLTAIAVIVLSTIGVAIKQGWFDSKTTYHSIFDSADGVHTGTPVHMSGLRIGSVTGVELREDNKIQVEFEIFSKFSERLRVDSTAQLLRPYIIGERVLDLSVGSLEEKELEAGGTINSLESADLMTLLGGRKFGVALGDMGEMVKNLRFLAEAFLDKDRTASLVKIFDRIDPLLNNLSAMSVEVTKLSKQATKDNHMGTVMAELALTTKELNVFLPDLRDRAPKVASDLEKLVSNLTELTEHSKVLLPALAEIAPELPRSSRKAIEALDETVVLLKALQKSFLLRSSAQEVREEQKQKEKLLEESRKPASQDGQ